MRLIVLSEADQAERIVKDGGVSLYGDGAALVRDTFGDVFEVSPGGSCECGRNGCEHALAATLEAGKVAAMSALYASGITTTGRAA